MCLRREFSVSKKQMENKRIGNDANVSDDDDDEVRLPADTLAILGKFLQEREEQQQTESDGIFEENWVCLWTTASEPV